jgi:hypothetical protein
MNAQADSGARSTVSGNMGGGPGEGCTVRARTCTQERLQPVPRRGGPEERTWSRAGEETSSALKRRHSRLRRQAARLSSLCRGVDWDGLAFRARKGGQVEVTGGSGGPGPTSTRRTGQGEGWPPDRRHGLAGNPGRRRSATRPPDPGNGPAHRRLPRAGPPPGGPARPRLGHGKREAVEEIGRSPAFCLRGLPEFGVPRVSLEGPSIDLPAVVAKSDDVAF